MGRKLLDHVPVVNILNEQKQVRAEIASLQALSGHADRDELIKWLEPLAKSLKRIFLVHGETDSSAALAQTIQKAYGIDAVPAVRGMTVPLSR